MAYTCVATSGIVNGSGGSWTHTFTQNNAILAQEGNDSSVTPALGDFKTQTPTNLNLDKSSGVFGAAAAAHFSLVAPAGVTKITGPTNAETWIAQEWSGNDTTTLLDTSNSAGSLTLAASPLTGPAITVGANAGLVIASTTLNTTSASSGLTVTGTSFSDTFITSHDGTQQNDSVDDAFTSNNRTASVSGSISDSWSWTSGNMQQRAEVITSYNATAGAAQVTPPLLLVPTAVRFIK